MASKKGRETPEQKDQEVLNKAFEKSTGMPVVKTQNDTQGNTTFSKDVYEKDR
jgi:hypothetical protein